MLLMTHSSECFGSCLKARWALKDMMRSSITKLIWVTSPTASSSTNRSSNLRRLIAKLRMVWDGSFLLTSHDASKPRTVSSRCCPTSSLSSSTRSAAASLASVFPDSLRSSVEKLMLYMTSLKMKKGPRRSGWFALVPAFPDAFPDALLSVIVSGLCELALHAPLRPKNDLDVTGVLAVAGVWESGVQKLPECCTPGMLRVDWRCVGVANEALDVRVWTRTLCWWKMSTTSRTKSKTAGESVSAGLRVPRYALPRRADPGKSSGPLIVEKKSRGISKTQQTSATSKS
mmetsp:Transcript_24225/g.57750  ORF Transcript_24225/g.57750 Transcript_24225/m.57750 type:complete len:287 (-) Transcript_24225:21-881(-)